MDGLQNIRLTIEYDGESFMGWQKQVSDNTIQGQLERVIEKVLGKRHPVVGAGRTDSGVHARGQVAHFFSPPSIPPQRWVPIFNTQLPRTIRVIKSEAAPLRFHAQKSAKSKVYVYQVLNSKAASALDRRVYFYPLALDWDRIRVALPYFVGTHDFKSFQGPKSTVVTTERTLIRFELRQLSAYLYEFELEGTGFLKQMVRTIIGTLIEIGEGKRNPDEIPKIIQARNRRAAGRTAPASGLCLLRVNYGEP